MKWCRELYVAHLRSHTASCAEPPKGHVRVQRWQLPLQGFSFEPLGVLEVGTVAGNCRRLSLQGRKLSRT